MSDLVVIDASVLLAIALPDPQANKDYASAQLATLDKKLMPHLRSNNVQRWEP